MCMEDDALWLHTIANKLNIHSIAELTQYAVRAGLTSLEF